MSFFATAPSLSEKKVQKPQGTNMHPLGTKVYLLKRYRPSDSFCTFFSESVDSILVLFRRLENYS